MTFPCPICGQKAQKRTSMMASQTTRISYYNCGNLACLHQFKTLEGDPVSISRPVNMTDWPKEEKATKAASGITRLPGKTIHTLPG